MTGPVLGAKSEFTVNVRRPSLAHLVLFASAQACCDFMYTICNRQPMTSDCLLARDLEEHLAPGPAY
jgi:hypothetical protein